MLVLFFVFLNIHWQCHIASLTFTYPAFSKHICPYFYYILFESDWGKSTQLFTKIFQGGCHTPEPVQPECDPQEEVLWLWDAPDDLHQWQLGAIAAGGGKDTTCQLIFGYSLTLICTSGQF